MKILSLFSGAGGLDVGARASGATVLASLEADGDCCATLRANNFQHVIEGKIEDCDPGELRRRLGLRTGQLDLLVGGPPCQPFSKSAFWTSGAGRGLNDPRAGTLKSFLDYLEEFRPKALLLENVEGFRSGGGLEYVLQRLDKIGGLTAGWKILDASEFGVPQRRRRLFLVAFSGGQTFEFPKRTHGPGGIEFATTWDSIGTISNSYEEDLRIRGRWADLVPTVPEGKNYLWHTVKGGGEPLFGWRTRFWSFLLKLDKAAPAPTIVASPSQNSGPYHWTNRLLSTPELAALQTFPRDYYFAGDRTSRQRQIGNAVPPLLASVLVSAIGEQLGLQLHRQMDLFVPKAARPPKPEPISAVPRVFLALRGEHAAHPGTGKGPRPRQKASKEKDRPSTPEPVRAKDDAQAA